MNQWLHSLSKNTIAFLAIVGGILLIVLSQPPHTVCDSQVAEIQESQKHFLYIDPPDSKVIKTTRYEVLRDRCKSSNDPGGCYELFEGIKVPLNDLNAFPAECGAALGGVAPVKKARWETVDLLVRLGWGSKPPTSYNAKFGWLDTADITLYCKLKTRISFMFGEPAWASFREKTMADLPGSKDLTRNQVWDMSLLSENCARYP
jgi:hypothetical protein